MSGTFSFYADGKFGQYSVKGQIVDKAKNGNCEIELEPVAWINQPSSYTMLDKMTLEVTQSYSQITSSSYSLSLSTAEADKYNIKTAEDLKNLNNSSKAYFFGLI